MEKHIKPIHKFNNGKGATLCNECSVIIIEKLTDQLYCNKCKPMEEEKDLYSKTMNELQEKWKENEKKYRKENNNYRGIRSSQIAALVDYLIKKGVITE